jgi:hypothetical protein
MMWRTRCFLVKNIRYIKLHMLFKEQRNLSLGDLCGEGTPGNISNPEVKVSSADGTWGAVPWESRSLPRDFSFKIL